MGYSVFQSQSSSTQNLESHFGNKNVIVHVIPTQYDLAPRSFPLKILTMLRTCMLRFGSFIVHLHRNTSTSATRDGRIPHKLSPPFRTKSAASSLFKKLEALFVQQLQTRNVVLRGIPRVESILTGLLAAYERFSVDNRSKRWRFLMEHPK